MALTEPQQVQLTAELNQFRSWNKVFYSTMEKYGIRDEGNGGILAEIEKALKERDKYKKEIELRNSVE